MQTMRFSVDISAEKYLAYYAGAAKFIRVVTEDGRTLKFPAAELQKFVTHEGIQGRFEIIFNDQHKLLKLTRL